MGVLNGQGLFSSTIAGLTNTYSTLAKYNNSANLSLDDLQNPSTDVLNNLGYNNTFLQYLTSNFSSIDKDNDGVINATDLSKFTQKIQSQGLTYNEIAQLSASGQISTSLSETVLTYFNKIDKNGDGRVTSEEISSFGYEAERQKMDTKYNSFKKSSMTTFYGSDTEDETPSSIIDSMYPTDVNS